MGYYFLDCEGGGKAQGGVFPVCGAQGVDLGENIAFERVDVVVAVLGQGRGEGCVCKDFAQPVAAKVGVDCGWEVFDVVLVVGSLESDRAE